MATIVTQYLDYYNVSGTVSLEPLQPITVAHIIMNGNITITATDIDDGELVTLIIEQGGSGGYTVTWDSATIDFNGKTQPTIPTGVGQKTTAMFVGEGGKLRFIA